MPERFTFCGECGSRLDTSEPEVAGRRQVTCVFADISGFTSLAEHLAPEQLHAVMRTAWDEIADEIRKTEGMVEKYIGDAVVAVFGAPIAHDDDPERALAATLAMQQALDRVNVDIEAKTHRRLSLRIGVNTGVAMAGAIGDRESEYGVLGDAVNVAARLQQAAEPGEILVGDATYRQSAHAFAYEPHPPVLAKGKSAPLVAWRLIERSLSSVAAQRMPLVGRSDALGQLFDALADAEGGAARVVSLVGEPGMGASRLVSELVSDPRARPLRVARAACAPYDRTRAYGPIGELLRALLALPRTDTLAEARKTISDMLPGLEPEVRGMVLEILGYPASSQQLAPSTRRRFVERGVRDLLRRVAETQPVLLTIEDVDEMDAGSLRLLRTAFAGLGSARALVVTTHHPEFMPPWATRPNHQQIRLAPLAAEEAGQLLRALLPGAPLPDELVRRVVAHTGGVPAFLEEATRAMTDAGMIVERDGTTVLDLAREPQLPATFAGLVQQRLERLGQDDRKVLAAASVLGRTADLATLGAVVGHEVGLDDCVERLVAAGILDREGDEAVRFRHGVARDAVYRAMLARARGELHGRAALAIERLRPDLAQDRPELLAAHLALSSYTLRAIDYVLRAGERALSLDDLPGAAFHFRTAVELSERGPEGQSERGRAFRRLAEVERLRGQLEAAASAYEQALAATDQPEESVRLHARIGRVRAERGELERAAEHLAAAELAAAGSSPEVKMELAVATAWLALRGDRPDEAIAVAEEAAREAAAIGDPGAELEVPLVAARAARLSGRADRRRAALEHAFALAQAAGDLFLAAEMLLELAALLGDLGLHDERDLRAREALDAYSRLGDDAGRARALGAIADARMGRGDLRGADEALAEAVPLARATEGSSEILADLLYSAGELALTRGDLGSAEAHLVEAFERATDRTRHLLVRVLVAMARVSVETGDVLRARGLVDEAMERQRGDGCIRCAARIAPVASDVALATGDFQAAQAHCAGGLERATSAQLRLEGAQVRLALARAAVASGDHARARDGIAAAIEQLTEFGAAHLAALAMLEQADALAALGEAEAARDALHRAHEAFTQMGAPTRAGQAADRLVRLASAGLSAG